MPCPTNDKPDMPDDWSQELWELFKFLKCKKIKRYSGVKLTRRCEEEKK